MPKMPEVPAINQQTIVSGQQGLEALAQGASIVADTGIKIATKLAEYESNALLYSNTTNLSDAKQKAASDIYKADSPEAIEKSVAAYKSTVNLMRENAVLNVSDRQKFDTISLATEDSIDTLGLKESIRLLRAKNRNAVLGGFKTGLSNYQQELLRNPEAAEEDFKSKIQTFDNAYMGGLITEDQHTNAVGAYVFMKEKATDLMSKVNKGIATSFDYNQGTSLSGEAVSSRPTTEFVGKFQRDYVTRTNYQGFMRDMVNGKIDELAYLDFNENERTMALDAFNGYQRAVSMIQSNIPLPVINERLAKLSNASSSALTEGERVERETLQMAKNEIDNNFMGFMLKTSGGAAIARDFKIETDGIKNSSLSDEEKVNAMRTLYNKEVTNIVGLAKAQGFSANQIKPANIDDVQSISDGFQQGGNPANIINAVRQYDKSNMPWLANSIKNSRQAEIVQAIGYNADKITAQNEPFVNRMILANQEGVNYHTLVQDKKDGTDNGSINSQIITQVQPVLAYLKTYPNGAQAANDIVQSVQNYVKYAALSSGNNQLTQSQMKQYVSEGAKLYLDAYPLAQGRNYIFNLNEVDMAPTDIRNVTYMVGRKLQDSDVYRNTPYTVTYSGGDIVAVDSFGSVLYRQQYDRHLLSAASGFWREAQADVAKQKVADKQLFAPIVGR